MSHIDDKGEDMENYRIIIEEKYTNNDENARKEKFTAIIKQLIKKELEDIENTPKYCK